MSSKSLTSTNIKLISKRESLGKVKRQYKWLCENVYPYYEYFFMDYLINKYKNICVIGDYNLVYEGDYNTFLINGRRMVIDEFIKSQTLQKLKKKVSNCSKRFIVFLVIFAKSLNVTSTHGNAVIYDTKKNELELFEPWGSKMYEKMKFYNEHMIYYRYVFTIKQFFQHILDQKAESKALTKGKRKGKKIKFYEPITTKQEEDFQNYEVSICKDSDLNLKVSPNGGFCAIWSMYYLETRLKNPDIPVNKLRKNLFKYFTESNDKEEICRMIREYTLFVIKLDKNKNWIQKKLIFAKVYPINMVKVVIYLVLDDLHRMFFGTKLKKV